MEVVNHNQDHLLGKSKPDNEYTQGEFADCDFGEDISNILQLDDVIAENTVTDKIKSKKHQVSEISSIDDIPEKKTNQSSSLNRRKEANLRHIINQSQKKYLLNKKLKNDKCWVDEMNSIPYIIDEDINIKYGSALKVIGTPIMNTEEADEILKALVDNSCEKNDENVDLRCKSCGFYSENVQARIEHLKGARHAAGTEVRNAIRLGILENYTINTFYCTICDWFITDISSIIDHILCSRHKDADHIYHFGTPGLLLNSFCDKCKYILKSNKAICNHMSSEHSSIRYYFSQMKTHIALKVNREGEVFCGLCKCYIRFYETNDHLNRHEEVCHDFNMKHERCSKNYSYFERNDMRCKWLHECLYCRGSHPQIDCSQKKTKSIPVLEDPFERGISRNETYDSLLPENANVSKVQKNLPSRHHKYKENEYESVISKQSPKSDIQYSSKSSSHRTSNRDISKSNSFDRRNPSKEHSYRHYRDQIRRKEKEERKKEKEEGIPNSCLHSVDISVDEEKELSLNTAIVGLLEICNILGNLGIFFGIALKKALAKKESKEDILNVLNEKANIILMEVIHKKLESCERVNDMLLYTKMKKGIKYLRYLINISKSSHQGMSQGFLQS